MNEEEQAVHDATKKFYDGIGEMAAGKGIDKIDESWHHTDRVTTRHPMDDWSVGWDLIWETWKFTASFGREDRGGGGVLSIVPYVYGDVAYCTVVFQAAPAWGGEKMCCTNVLHKKDGQWKVIHHHADPSPAMQVALEKMIAEG